MDLFFPPLLTASLQPERSGGTVVKRLAKKNSANSLPLLCTETVGYGGPNSLPNQTKPNHFIWFGPVQTASL